MRGFKHGKAVAPESRLQENIGDKCKHLILELIPRASERDLAALRVITNPK